MSHSDLKRILIQYDIHTADAEDLKVLQNYEIVLICDDSGSMNLGTLPGDKWSTTGPTRWSELKESVGCIVELASCFDKNGIDIFFLNSPAIKGVTSVKDPRFTAFFAGQPRGITPLTETLCTVAQEVGGRKPVLLIIFTDGEPDDGSAKFISAVGDLVKRRSTPHTFKVLIMACTEDDEAVGWLNDLDGRFAEVDCVDDYQSERDQILKAGRVNQFTKGDWIMKALLGPVLKKFGDLDEKKGILSCFAWCCK